MAEGRFQPPPNAARYRLLPGQNFLTLDLTRHTFTLAIQLSLFVIFFYGLLFNWSQAWSICLKFHPEAPLQQIFKKYWDAALSSRLNSEHKAPIVHGWMDVHFGPWALTLSKDYSLASYPSAAIECNALGWVIPANNQNHSCKYSTGVNRTVLSC